MGFGDQRGSVTFMVAVALPVLLIAAGAAIDFARLIDRQGSAQAHVDAAALGAAHMMVSGLTGTAAQQADSVKRRAFEILDAAGEDFDDSLDVKVDLPAKRVQISAEATVETSFLRIASFATLARPVHATAQALSEDQPVCILALKPDDGVGISFTGAGEMKAKNCVVWSNATGSQSVTFDGNGKVETSRLCAVGRISSASRFKVKPVPEDGCEHVDDPMADWTPPDVGSCTSTYTGWITRTTAQLYPGVYCGGLRVDAMNIFMKPGVYVIKDGPLVLRGSSKIVGKDVGIYLTGENAALDIDGKSQVDIRSMTDGSMAGIVMASSPVAGRLHSSITGRSDLKIGGVIYLPTHDLEYIGESDTRAASPVTTILGYTIEIGGEAFLEVMNDKSKAKYAPIVSTGTGNVQLVN